MDAPLFKEPSVAEFLSDTPTCSPPWYATPDTSTPGEKYFTPSIDDDDREKGKHFGRPENDANAVANGDGESTAASSEVDGLTFLGPNIFADSEEAELKYASAAESPDDRGLRHADQRPISIGQEDEFILLPAFNPDFDEIFTSLTKYDSWNNISPLKNHLMEKGLANPN